MDAIKITSNRLAYIDLFQGIAIIGVVWVHSHIPPSWLTPFLVNSIFFFISGCFFNRRQDSFYNLIIKNTKRILIPFLFFYVLSYPFRIIVHFWDYRTLSNFDWLCVFDVFHQHILLCDKKISRYHHCVDCRRMPLPEILFLQYSFLLYDQCFPLLAGDVCSWKYFRAAFH